ncbi:DUF1636 domain-containing protein [Roseibium salinum]|uniref:DUF1636 domain-containing protein n=1 Tax=Roseibium salinum TaxID=1604349 RepID=A0ABT3QX30_9HYPH|nr:DUF1636 domain-containing protein [Roseibium sp. DSM 29163]MCX2721471.1 DUF1636 domain-containing protein [Roseibium sp. DSM 29163]
MNRIVICRTCKNGPSGAESRVADLAQALRDNHLDHAFSIETADCMGACEQPISLALQGEGRATYLFAGLSIPDDIEDIVATGRTYLDAENGWIEDARPCGRLRFCLRARVPALMAAKPDVTGDRR